MLFQCFVFFLQFFHFYIQSYRQKRDEKKQRKAAAAAAAAQDAEVRQNNGAANNNNYDAQAETDTKKDL